MSDLAGTWVREFGYRGAHMTSVTEQPAEADSSEALHTEIIRDDLGRISGVDSPAGLVMYTYTDAQMLSSAVRGTETLRWTYDAAGALVRVEYFDSAQPQNACSCKYRKRHTCRRCPSGSSGYSGIQDD